MPRHGRSSVVWWCQLACIDSCVFVTLYLLLCAIDSALSLSCGNMFILSTRPESNWLLCVVLSNILPCGILTIQVRSLRRMEELESDCRLDAISLLSTIMLYLTGIRGVDGWICGRLFFGTIVTYAYPRIWYVG